MFSELTNIVNGFKESLKRRLDENSERSKAKLREGFEKKYFQKQLPDDVENVERHI